MIHQNNNPDGNVTIIELIVENGIIYTARQT